jgi:hypothetical protein
METILNALAFWSYVISEWVPKCEMWVMGNWNLLYAGQDTNIAIESHHANLRMTLKVSKSRLSKKWVD